MNNIELQNVWKSYDQKLQDILTLNEEIALNLSKQKLDKQISKLNRPKRIVVLIGVPYTILLIGVTIVAAISKAYFVAMGFGAIALIMSIVLGNYFFQLNLIRAINNSDNVLLTQKHLSKLRISSFNTLIFSIFQLPFWSICWISIEGLKASPYLYGGINLLVFITLTLLSFWLYKELNHHNKKSKIRDFFLSGNEWEPIAKSADILEQIKEYEK